MCPRPSRRGSLRQHGRKTDRIDVALVAAQRPDLPRVTADDCRVLRLLADRRVTSERRRRSTGCTDTARPDRRRNRRSRRPARRRRVRWPETSSSTCGASTAPAQVDAAPPRGRQRHQPATRGSATCSPPRSCGDIGRFPSADRLASYAGPIEASSGTSCATDSTATANSTTPSTSPPDHPPRPRTRLLPARDAQATAATKPSDSSNDNSPKPSTARSSPTPTAPAKTPLSPLARSRTVAVPPRDGRSRRPERPTPPTPLQAPPPGQSSRPLRARR